MKPKVAVVGSGIAGLTVAWLLRNKYQVTILEKGKSLGMGQFGVTAKTATGSAIVDVPLRVFNKSYYPNLFQMCRNLGISLRFVDHGGAFGYINGDLYFKYENFALGAKNFSYVFPRVRHIPWLLTVGREILKLKKDMPKFLSQPGKDSITLGDFFRNYGYSKSFQYEFFLPILSTVATCTYTALLNYPAGILLEGMQTLMETTPTQRFIGGTSALQAQLAGEIQDIRFDHGVKNISLQGDGIGISFSNGEHEHFDHVIFATQANQAARILGSSFDKEKGLLERIEYQQSDMVVHRDESLMPKGRQRWAPVYYGINDHDWPMATIWINKVEPGFDGGEPLFQTWNPLVEPDPKKVLGRTTFERPIVSKDSLNAIEELAKLQKEKAANRRLWFCGSYAIRAIPLLEAGLVSAVEIAEQLGIEAPSWFAEPRSKHDRQVGIAN